MPFSPDFPVRPGRRVAGRKSAAEATPLADPEQPRGPAGAPLGARRERPGLLALDVSKRAIGVAGADAGWRLATPLTHDPRARAGRRIWNGSSASSRERAAGALVIGWPLNMDGSEGPRCQAVRAFADKLDAALGLPILLWDERLTTFAAEEAAERAGLRGKKRTEMLDALAAAAVLQDLLNTLARQS